MNNYPSKNAVDAILELAKDKNGYFHKKESSRGFRTIGEVVNYLCDGRYDADCDMRDEAEAPLEKLTFSELQDVIAIMNVGRGLFETYHSAREFLPLKPEEGYSKDTAISYMMGKSRLRLYLEQGLYSVNS